MLAEVAAALLTVAAMAMLVPWRRLRPAQWLPVALLTVASVLLQTPQFNVVIQGALVALLPLGVIMLVTQRLTVADVALPLAAGVALALTSAASIDPTTSLLKALSWLGLAVATFVLITWGRGSLPDHEVRRVVAVQLTCTVPFVVLGFMLLSLVTGGGFDTGSTGIPQLTATVAAMHPNTVAFFLAFGVVGALWREAPTTLGVLVVRAAPFLGLVAMTRSRSGLVIAVLAVVVMARYLTAFSRAVAWPLAGCLVVTYLALQPEVLSAFVLRGQSGGDLMALSGRMPLWSAALDAVVERPFLGWGYDVGPAWAILEFSHEYLAYDVATSDNMYLDLAVSGGLPLLVVWTALVVVMVKRVLQAPSAPGGVPKGVLGVCVLMVLMRTTGGSGFDVVGPITVAALMVWFAVSSPLTAGIRRSGRRWAHA